MNLSVATVAAMLFLCFLCPGNHKTRTMKKSLLLSLMMLAACGGTLQEELEPALQEPFEMTPAGIARMLAQLPIGPGQLQEVADAVGGSSSNGYDEEYTMNLLLSAPGAGVGPQTRALNSYDKPLRDMIRDWLGDRPSTRGDVEDIMSMLEESGFQIYWPYSEDWDQTSYPVITYDPGWGAESNWGYELAPGPDGAVIADTLLVDEALAKKRPVWVVNSNSDSGFTPLELFAQKAPDSPEAQPSAKNRKLMLRSFQMLRNYDSWFGGASEFWIKCGAVEGFTASTEAELKLYTPSVTDFMIIVKRKYVGKVMPYEAILVADYTAQMDKLAFLITEDDGGTRTTWKCDATVKIQSKAYGFTLDIPYNEKDDIVWRGQLPVSFFQEEDIVKGRFGDVVIAFELQ